MLFSNLPEKFVLPFAANAGAGYVRAIPTESQIGVEDGAASLNDGFPPLTATPISAGGIPPSIQDFNGLLRQMTAWLRWAGAGGVVRFDSNFAAAIGGYPRGALVQSTTSNAGFWISRIDNNTEDPDAGGSVESPVNWTYMISDRASSAEILGRTRGDKLITPLGLAQATPYGQNANGYYERLASGRWEQWGRTVPISQNMGAITLPFPMEFPSACQSLQLTTVNPNGLPTDAFDTWAQVVSYTKTNFTVCNQAVLSAAAANALPIEWRATGR